MNSNLAYKTDEKMRLIQMRDLLSRNLFIVYIYELGIRISIETK